jgi:hypothetical protein
MDARRSKAQDEQKAACRNERYVELEEPFGVSDRATLFHQPDLLSRQLDQSAYAPASPQSAQIGSSEPKCGPRRSAALSGSPV